MNGVDIFVGLNLAAWASALQMFRSELGKHGFTNDESQAFCLALFSAAANAQTSINLSAQAK